MLQNTLEDSFNESNDDSEFYFKELKGILYVCRHAHNFKKIYN